MDTSSTENELLEAILENVKTKLQSSGVCQELTTMWLEMWDEEEREKRKEIMAKECGEDLKEVVQSVIQKETGTRQNYIERIEKLLLEMNELQTNLAITIPYEDVQSLPLHNMAFNLNKKAEKYRLIKDDRMNRLALLQQKELPLCEMLGMSPTIVEDGKIPTETELKQIENSIEAMEREKLDRTFTFLEKRKIICEMYRELGIQPANKFEKNVVSEDSVDGFEVNNENMTLLDELQRILTEQLADAKQTVSDLKEKLQLIWSYLDEPESYSAMFLSNHSGHNVTSIAAMREELTRCEGMKRTNIAKIVARIRKILVAEWDRCLVSQEERDKFRAFYIDCFTEDLCELHEIEIERLKRFYSDNEQIFSLFAKHQRLFMKLLELEDRGKNVNRYYNRGGQLLQEERERKTITKELPVVEDELRQLLARYEEEHRTPFTSYGEPLCKKLDDQWANHFDQKTIEKLARKIGGSEKKKKTPLGKRGCPTPSSNAVASKVSRLHTDKVSSTTKLHQLVTPVRNVCARRKLLTKSKSDEPDSTFLIDPTYDDFQNELQAKVESSDALKKNVTRSTAVMDPSGRVLRERNTPASKAAKTPSKPQTPAWIPGCSKTPMTFPRATKRKSLIQRSPSHPNLPRLTPARSRLPIII